MNSLSQKVIRMRFLLGAAFVLFVVIVLFNFYIDPTLGDSPVDSSVADWEPPTGQPAPDTRMVEVKKSFEKSSDQNDSVVVSARPALGLWENLLTKIDDKDRRGWGDRVRRRVSIALVNNFVQNTNLPVAQKDELQRLLVDKEHLEFDLREIAREKGIVIPSVEFDSMRISETERLNRSIKSLLSEDEYTIVQQGLHKEQSRLYVIEFVGEAVLQGVPTTPSQRQEMTAILAEIDRGNWKEEMNSTPDPATGLTIYDVRALQRLGEVLTPNQLEILRATRFETNLYKEDKKRVRRMTLDQ